MAASLAGCAGPGASPIPTPTAPLAAADHLLADDGWPLPLARTSPAGPPRAVLVALHGFNDHGGGWHDAAEAWASTGIATWAIDQRGFGRGPGTRGWFGDARLVADAKLAVREAARAHPNRPILLIGESMGAAVAWLAAADPGLPLAGLVLLAPAVRGRDSMDMVTRVGLWLARRLPDDLYLAPSGGVGPAPTDSPETMRRLARDPLVLKGARIAALVGLADLMEAAVAAPPPPVPTLALFGRRDGLVPLEAACRFIADLDPATVVAIYSQGFHLLTRDRAGGTVVRDVASWITAPTSPLPSDRGRTPTAALAENCDPAGLAGGPGAPHTEANDR